MRIWNVCFLTGAVAALVGMGLGIGMGAKHDFMLAPVHAHINLLGWVSMVLFGLFYRGAAQAASRLARMQVTCAACGFPLMTGGLALLLTNRAGAAAEPLIVVGSLLSLLSMILFTFIVMANARHE